MGTLNWARVSVLGVVATAGCVTGLGLRASPMMSFAPSLVTLRVDFSDVTDVESIYCPMLEWDFDDGSKSIRGSDCVPYRPGIERESRFSITHCYGAGDFNPTVRVLRGGRAVLSRTAPTVRVKWSPVGVSCAS